MTTSTTHTKQPTERQLAVIAGIHAGLTVKQIAAEFGIDPNSVYMLLRRLRERTGGEMGNLRGMDRISASGMITDVGVLPAVRQRIAVVNVRIAELDATLQRARAELASLHATEKLLADAGND